MVKGWLRVTVPWKIIECYDRRRYKSPLVCAPVIAQPPTCASTVCVLVCVPVMALYNFSKALDVLPGHIKCLHFFTTGLCKPTLLQKRCVLLHKSHTWSIERDNCKDPRIYTLLGEKSGCPISRCSQSIRALHFWCGLARLARGCVGVRGVCVGVRGARGAESTSSAFEKLPHSNRTLFPQGPRSMCFWVTPRTETKTICEFCLALLQKNRALF